MENESCQLDDAVDGAEEVRRRPHGVTLIAILLFVYAAALAGVLILALLHSEALHSFDSSRNSALAWQLAFTTPLRIGMAIVLGVGLLHLRRWARKGLIFFAGVTVLGRGSMFIRPASFKIPLTYAQEAELMASILLIGYLVSSHVSSAFELGPQSDD